MDYIYNIYNTIYNIFHSLNFIMISLFQIFFIFLYICVKMHKNPQCSDK